MLQCIKQVFLRISVPGPEKTKKKINGQTESTQPESTGRGGGGGREGLV